MGLSLAIVGSVVSSHHGWAEAENSADGSATAFHVYLPALEDAAAPAPSLDAAPPAAARSGAGGETILLVEDEAPVREFTRAVLQAEGYRVLQAASGRDALESWKWHSERIRLLITDFVLPDDFDGLDLARRLQAEKPALPVLCTSGIPGDILQPEASPLRLRFLPKPYAIQQLIRTVRDCLASA